MDALILGEGIAAHAIAWKLAENRKTENLYCTSRFSGIDTLCTKIEGDPEEWRKTHPVDLAVQAVPETIYKDAFDIPVHAVHIVADCLADGHNIVPLPAVRVFPDAAGEAMAAEAPTEVFTDDLAHYAYHQFFVPYIRNRGFSGKGLCGVIRFEMALTGGKLKLRSVSKGMGDIDAAALLPLLRGELAKLLNTCENGEVSEDMLRLNGACTAAVMLGADKPDAPIIGLRDVPSEVGVFMGHTLYRDRTMYTAGEKPLCVCARAATLQAAREAVLDAAAKIRFEGIRRGAFTE